MLEEIRELNDSSEYPVFGIGALIDEAKDYAQRMSAKLTEYKRQQAPDTTTKPYVDPHKFGRTDRD